MKHQEENGYKVAPYLHHQSMEQDDPASSYLADLGNAPVDADCRFRMAEWCHQIVDFCKFQRETVAVAMSYLDRMLASPEHGPSILQDRVQFQLAAMTALYTAVKVHEPEAMDPNLIASLSRGTYTSAQVEAMERRILQSIQWRVNPPTALAFALQALSLVPTTLLSRRTRAAVVDLAKYQTELVVSDYEFATVPPSAVAFSALTNAVVHHADLQVRNHIEYVLAHALGVDARSRAVLELRIRMSDLVQQSPNASLVSSKIPVNETSSTSCGKSVSMDSSVHRSPRSVSGEAR